MILRLVGSMLVMGAALWVGAYFAAKEKYRLKELEALERGMLLLQGQIEYFSVPLPEGLESIGGKIEGVIGETFRRVAACMAERKGDSAEGIWQEVWEETRSFLTKEDMEAVLLFGKTLGYLDREQQMGNIRLFLRYLTEHMESGRKHLEKNGRLYYSVSALSGILLVVTLL